MTEFDTIPAISHGPFVATPIGLIVEKAVPYRLWEAYGGALRQVEKSLQWIIGDWINYGEDHYGEIYTQATELWPGMSKERLIRYAWVSRSVPRYLRKHELAWSHHVEVAKLPPPEQKAKLEEAIEEDLTVRELRERIAGHNVRKPKIVTCPECGHKWEV